MVEQTQAQKKCSQFMKILLDKDDFPKRLVTCLNPPQSFKDTQPDNASLFFISILINMSDQSVNMLNATLDTITSTILTISLDNKNYRIFTNCMKFLYVLTLSVTSIECFEALVKNSRLLEAMQQIASKPEE